MQKRRERAAGWVQAAGEAQARSRVADARARRWMLRLGAGLCACTCAWVTCMSALCWSLPYASASPSGASMYVNDHAKLSLHKAFGAVLIEEGSSSGTLAGHTWVRLVVRSGVSAQFTIWTKGGSIHGTGGAALHSTGRYASFGGWLRVTGGTGRYAHAYGSGHLYGVIDRRKRTVTVKTVGALHY